MIGAIPIIAENRIRKATERGEFDHLEGAGRPFPDLGGYDGPDWWITHTLQREQLSAQDTTALTKEQRS